MADTITVSCPECGKVGKAPIEAIGKRIKCKVCQTVFEATAQIMDQTMPLIVNSEAIHRLLGMLTNDDPKLRSQAAKKLGGTGDPRVVRALIEALNDDTYDNTYYVRRAALESLALIGEAAVVPLVEQLGIDDFHVGQAVQEALSKIGVVAIPSLINVLSTNSDRLVRHRAAVVLGEIGHANASARLVVALQDEDWTVRSAAAAALGQIGDVSAIGPLKKTLQDSTAEVRKAASEALQALNSKSESQSARLVRTTGGEGNVDWNWERRTCDPTEAVRWLFEQAVPLVPQLRADEIEKYFHDWAGGQGIQLHEGPRRDIEALVKAHFVSLRRQPAFEDFLIQTYERWQCVFTKSFSRGAVNFVLVWRGTNRLAAAGTGDFAR